MTTFKDKVFTFHYRNGNIVGIFAGGIGSVLPVKCFELKELIAYIESDWCESFDEGVEALIVADVYDDDITVSIRALLHKFKDLLIVNPEELSNLIDGVSRWSMKEELKEELLNIVCDGDFEKFHEIFRKMF